MSAVNIVDDIYSITQEFQTKRSGLSSKKHPKTRRHFFEMEALLSKYLNDLTKPAQPSPTPISAADLKKITITTLWQQLKICNEKIAKQEFIDKLVKLLDLNPEQVSRAKRFGWLPGVSSVETLIKQEIQKQNIEIIDFNPRNKYRNSQIKKLLNYYKDLINSKPKNAEKKSEIRSSLYQTRILLNYLYSNQDLDQLYGSKKITDPKLVSWISSWSFYLSGNIKLRLEKCEAKLLVYRTQVFNKAGKGLTQNKIDHIAEIDECLRALKNESPLEEIQDLFPQLTDPKLQKLFASISKQSIAQQQYTKARETFHKVANDPYSSSILNDSSLDPNMRDIVLMLNRLQDHKFLIEKFRNPKYFANEFPDNPEKNLQNFQDFLIRKFQELQSTDFKYYDYDISEIKKRITVLNPFKKSINRWAQDNGLKFSIRRLTEKEYIYNSCRILIRNLNPEQHEIADLNKQLNSVLNPNDADLIMLERIIRKIQAKLNKTNPNEQIYQRCRYYMNLYRNDLLVDLKFKFDEFTLPLDREQTAELKKFEAAMIVTLQTHQVEVPLACPVYTKTNFKAPTQEKLNYRKQKASWLTATNVATLILSFGQAALGFFGFIGLIPVLGTAISASLAVVCFFASFYTNYQLFKGATFVTAKQLFINGDFSNGFTSFSGKTLMACIALVALALSSTMGLLSFIAVMTTIPFAPAAIAPAIIVATTTFIGFASLMYVTMAEIIKSICTGLENLIPEIKEQGWGLTGLVRGSILGLSRLGNNIQNQGGIFASIGMLLSKARYYWANPTGNPNATTTEIRFAKVHLIVSGIIKPLVLALALGTFAFATYSTLCTWNTLMIGALASNPIISLSNTIATAISTAIVVVLSGVGVCMFNMKNITGFFFTVADATCSNIIMPVYKLCDKLITQPRQLAQDIGQSCRNTWNSFKSYCNQASRNPQQTVFKTLALTKRVVIDTASIALNALGVAAMVLINFIIPRGATSIWAAKPLDWIYSGSAFAGSNACNAMATLAEMENETPREIPLQKIKAQRKLDLATLRVPSAKSSPKVTKRILEQTQYTGVSRDLEEERLSQEIKANARLDEAAAEILSRRSQTSVCREETIPLVSSEARTHTPDISIGAN